jgi:hypothetical protein
VFTAADAADKLALAAESAGQLLAAALVEHELADASAAEAARLQPREQTALETRIAEHDTEARSVASILASDDLHDLPDELVDLDAPRAVFTAADAADKLALAAESTARCRPPARCARSTPWSTDSPAPCAARPPTP